MDKKEITDKVKQELDKQKERRSVLKEFINYLVQEIINKGGIDDISDLASNLISFYIDMLEFKIYNDLHCLLEFSKKCELGGVAEVKVKDLLETLDLLRNKGTKEERDG